MAALLATLSSSRRRELGDWEILKSRGPALGLHLNPSKCEWSWLDESCDLPCPIQLDGVREEDQVKLVPTSEIQMLGVPLGNDAFTSAFVEKKLFSRLNTTVGQLVEFEDTQSALFSSGFLTASCSSLHANNAVETKNRVRSSITWLGTQPKRSSRFR